MIKPDTNQDVHTTLYPQGGIRKYTIPFGERHSTLNPSSSQPAKSGLRYRIDMITLGKLERLAKARFQIRQLTNTDIDTWVEDAGSRDALAQSVNASSEIEGEGIAVEELSLVLAAATAPTNGHAVDREQRRRQMAIRSIYDAALWALSRDWSQFVTYDFVLELHKRMFESTRPAVAGCIKDGPVIIKGGDYYIETLPPEKSADYLRVLCERTNHKLLKAHEEASASMFLTVAEFVNDFLAIHPFADGNGRSARLLSTYLLEKSGYHFARFYPLDMIILETRSKYYEALFLSQRAWYSEAEDISAWIEYYTDTVYLQWTRAYQRVRDEANRGVRR